MTFADPVLPSTAFYGLWNATASIDTEASSNTSNGSIPGLQDGAAPVTDVPCLLVHQSSTLGSGESGLYTDTRAYVGYFPKQLEDGTAVTIVPRSRITINSREYRPDGAAFSSSDTDGVQTVNLRLQD